MRLIDVDQINSNMTLAKTLRDEKGNIILPAGSDVVKYITQLKRFNVKFLYVDDVLSEGIETNTILSDETRMELGKMTNRLNKVLKTPDVTPHKISAEINDSRFLVRKIVTDIMSNKDSYIDLTELRIYKNYYFRHEICVAIISSLIAKLIGQPFTSIEAICMGGLFHDIGTLNMPPELLAKIGSAKLTAYESNLYKDHPRLGYDIVKNDNSIPVLAKTAILQHHEHDDGNGYPYRKTGDSISVSAKIVSIAENYDALMNGQHEDYAVGSMRLYEVVEYMQNFSGKIFDREIMTEFFKNFVAFPNGTIVKLSDKRKGIVLNQNNNLTNRPIIRITHDANNEPTLGMVNLLEDMSIVIYDIETPV